MFRISIITASMVQTHTMVRSKHLQKTKSRLDKTENKSRPDRLKTKWKAAGLPE